MTNTSWLESLSKQPISEGGMLYFSKTHQAELLLLLEEIDSLREQNYKLCNWVSDSINDLAYRRLLKFAGTAIKAVRGNHLGLEWDGGDVQEAMLDCGLLVAVETEKFCGEACQCAEVYEEPGECLQLTDLGKKALKSV